MSGVHPGLEVLVGRIRQYLTAGCHYYTQAVINFRQGIFNLRLYTLNRPLCNFVAITGDTGRDIEFFGHIFFSPNPVYGRHPDANPLPRLPL